MVLIYRTPVEELTEYVGLLTQSIYLTVLNTIKASDVYQGLRVQTKDRVKIDREEREMKTKKRKQETKERKMKNKYYNFESTKR